MRRAAPEPRPAAGRQETARPRRSGCTAEHPYPGATVLRSDRPAESENPLKAAETEQCGNKIGNKCVFLTDKTFASMKKILLTCLLTLTAAGFASAQNYIVVNSEKVFKSLKEYNDALASLDRMAERYQEEVDRRFAEVETLYENYMAQKPSLTASARNARENAILAREKEVTEYQQQIFGTDGTLMKQRLELIRPIQERVFGAIEAYARQHGAELVLDSANNASLLFCNPAIDRTQQVSEALK